jgi:hypothetical protein
LLTAKRRKKRTPFIHGGMSILNIFFRNIPNGGNIIKPAIASDSPIRRSLKE